MRPIRSALIIGGASGLGNAVARQVLEGGATEVVVTGRHRESARHAAARLSDERAIGAALDIGGDQRAMYEFHTVWGQVRHGWDMVLFAGSSVCATPAAQQAQTEATRWLMDQSVNTWLHDGGVMAVVTSALIDSYVPAALRGLRPWLDGRADIAGRAAALGRNTEGVTVLDYAFTRIRDTHQWSGVPEFEAGLIEMEKTRAVPPAVELVPAAEFITYYARHRHQSGRLTAGAEHIPA